MAKQSQQMVAVMAVMVLLCASMMPVQVDAQGYPAPAPYTRGYEPVSPPSYAPEGSPIAAPIVGSPAYAPSVPVEGPGYSPGPSYGA